MIVKRNPSNDRNFITDAINEAIDAWFIIDALNDLYSNSVAPQQARSSVCRIQMYEVLPKVALQL